MGLEENPSMEEHSKVHVRVSTWNKMLISNTCVSDFQLCLRPSGAGHVLPILALFAMSA